MKKTLFTTSLIAIAYLAFVSCQVKMIELEKETKEEKRVEGTELHFIVKANQDSETKTAVTANGDGTYASTWKNNDELGAFLSATTINGSTEVVDMTLTNTAADGAAGVFEGSAVAEGSGDFMAFYPASAFATGYAGGTIGLNIGATSDYIQHPSVGSPDPACDILLSKACEYMSNGSTVVIDDLYFMRPLSILKINLKGSYAEGEEVSWLKFSVSDGTLSGRVKVDLTTPELGAWTVSKKYAWAEYSSSKPVINHATNNTVYLVVNPITLTTGTTVTVTGETTHVLIEKTFNLISNMTFPAGNIAVLNLTINAGDCTLKSAENYSLVTADGAFEAGSKYIFAFKDGKDGHYEFINNKGTTNTIDNATLTVSDGVISNPDSKYVFTASAGTSSGQFKFANASNKFIYYSGSSTTVDTNNETGSNWVPTFISASKTYEIQYNSNTGRYLSHNGSTAVKAYAPGSNPLVDQVAEGKALAQFTGAISVFKSTDGRTPLTTPTSLSVSDMTVSWAAVANAGSYNVTIDGTKYVTTSTSYTYTGRAGYYDVQVVAVPSIANAETYKNSAAAVLSDQIFGTPVILTPVLAKGSVTTTSIEVTWTDDTQATNGYHCELYIGAVKQNEKDVDYGDESVSFTGLTKSTEYIVKVNGKAVTGAKAYAASDVATINVTTSSLSGKTYTITFAKGTTFTTNVTSYTGSFVNSCDGLALTLANVNNGGNSNWTEMRAGRKEAASTPTITTNSAISKAIQHVSIHITQVNTSAISSSKLYVSSSSTFATKDTYDLPITGTGDATATISSPAEDKYYKIEIVTDNTADSNGHLRFDSIEYTTL